MRYIICRADKMWLFVTVFCLSITQPIRCPLSCDVSRKQLLQAALKKRIFKNGTECLPSFFCFISDQEIC